LNLSQLFLIDKPRGWTSFDATKYLKKITGLKVGHAGTLDPLASGLLLVCSGSLTKKISSFQDLLKEYEGEITLGASTPSFDAETEEIPVADASQLTPETIREATQSLVGEIIQYPPQYSAKKIDGKRAYEYVREGKTAEVRPALVTVHCFELLSFEPVEQKTKVKFRVICSKGTYIRSMANDLGQKLGCGGFLSDLRRTQIGDYRVENALCIEDLRELYPKRERLERG
jgi:tRNA pseudouridine55 synthase